MALTIDLVRKLTILDCLGGFRSGRVDDSVLKLYWNLFIGHKYNVARFCFTAEDEKFLLREDRYRGFPVYGYINEIAKLIGDHGLDEFAEAGRFQKNSFEYFLMDYLVYVKLYTFPLIPFDDQIVSWFGEPSGAHPLVPKIVEIYAIANQGALLNATIDSYDGAMLWIAFFNRWHMPKVPGYQHPGWLQDFLDAPADAIPHAKVCGLSNYIRIFLYTDPSLMNSFDVSVESSCREYVRWFVETQAKRLCGYRHPVWLAEILPLPVEGDMDDVLRGKSPDVSLIEGDIVGDESSSLQAPESYLGGGVNVVGWPRTENGIGEDVRVGFDALTSQGLDAIIVDASLRAPPAPQQKDLGYDQYTRDAPVFNTDIVYLDAATQFRYYFHDFMNSRDISDRRIIAVSPWELARWPEDLSFALDHVDEFWAASRFIFDAFSPYLGRDAIHLAPPAVVVPESELDEFDFSKIDEPLVFLTTFDGLSSIHRKNPFAAVKAFVAAFPIEKFGDVRLIVKTMNFSERNPQLRELGRLIASDSRISLINRAMPKGELFDLVRSAHCFISLHRSEGFGRNIAEMMLFGRPVVVSNYSGNVDFCFESNSFLVDGALVDVGANQYTFSQGQQWFDVAIESAVESLRKVYLGRDLAAKKADCGRAWIREKHSLNAVGLRYRELIEVG